MKRYVGIIVACCLVLSAAIWFSTPARRDTPTPASSTFGSTGSHEPPAQAPPTFPHSLPSVSPGAAGGQPPAATAARPIALQPIAPPTASPNEPLPVKDPVRSAGFAVPPVPQETVDASIDLNKVSLMMRDYRTIMGENPVGTNAEIMKAIMGANPKGAKLGPPEGLSLNSGGELIDRWGTPFFFHQISGTQMEIWSAGPDRKMGTSDDIIQK